MTDEDKLRISDIASLLSLPEDLVRRYADEYDEHLQHQSIGKVRIYNKGAVKRFRVIADLTAQGMSHDAIIPVLKGGKKITEFAPDEERRDTQSGPPPTPPGSDLLDEIVIAVARTSESTSQIEHRVSAIRDGMASDTDRILHEIRLLREEVGQSKTELRTLWSQVRELEEDIRERELRKSWIERVAEKLSR
ncbi:MAG: MerR family transcriptional regulator [Methanocalculus sp.]|nr:MerR family transcriptional regulator [Methanocalculus sp.]